MAVSADSPSTKNNEAMIHNKSLVHNNPIMRSEFLQHF